MTAKDIEKLFIEELGIEDNKIIMEIETQVINYPYKKKNSKTTP